MKRTEILDQLRGNEGIDKKFTRAHFNGDKLGVMLHACHPSHYGKNNGYLGQQKTENKELLFNKYKFQFGMMKKF
jgi:hypothetical protein